MNLVLWLPQSRPRKVSEDAIKYAHAIKVDAMTLMGEFLKGAEKNKGTRGQLLLPGPGRGRRDKTGGSPGAPPVSEVPTLASAGISKKESSVSQALAAIAEKKPELHEKVRSGEVSGQRTAPPRRGVNPGEAVRDRGIHAYDRDRAHNERPPRLTGLSRTGDRTIEPIHRSPGRALPPYPGGQARGYEANVLPRSGGNEKPAPRFEPERGGKHSRQQHSNGRGRAFKITPAPADGVGRRFGVTSPRR